MWNKISTLLVYFLLFSVTTSCVSRGDVPPATITPGMTDTPTPVFTLIPTTTPFPTVTPQKIETAKKMVLVEYGLYGGQSNQVNRMEFFLGRDVPRLVVYTDGQVISFLGDSFLVSQLSASDLCLLMGKIQKNGFFDYILVKGKNPGF